MPTKRKPMSIEEVKQFIFAGKAYFTMRSNESGRSEMFIIYKTKDYYMVYSGLAQDPTSSTDFKPDVLLGFIDPNVPLRLNGAPRRRGRRNFYPIHNGKTLGSVRAVDWLLSVLAERVLYRDNVDILNNGFCAKCGRKLTDDVSVDLGFGPTCWKSIRKEVI